MDNNDIMERAELILHTINSVFAANGMSLPSRQYIAVGEPGSTVHDCEQVTVSYVSAQLGLPSTAGGAIVCSLNVPTTAIFYAEIVRCVPGSSGTKNRAPKPPTERDLSKYSADRLTDSTLLLQAAYEAINSTWTQEGAADVSIGAASDMQAVTMSMSTVI